VPVEMELDLLVDGELAEERRRALLLAVEREPARWRGVAMRFLQRQTEKESVRKLMAGGRLVPVEVMPAVERKRAIIGRVGWKRVWAVAAGLLIAVMSATVTFVAMRSGTAGTPVGPVAVGTPAEYQTALPGDVMDAAGSVMVSVPVVPASADMPIVNVVPGSNFGQPVRNTILVQPDGNNGYMVIPVSMSRRPVY
jgi:hypothetical protein